MERRQATLMATQWNINTDIYGIVDSVKEVQKRYIEDEDETTLSLGIFGFIADTESKKIQTSTILAGQLGNEMFPTRAKLTKNVLAHATYNGINDINAKPADITVTLCIRINELDQNLIEGKFYLDAMTPIYIGNYEFHLDYDVEINKVRVKENTYSYSAKYITVNKVTDKKIINRLSDIINPYLRQPYVMYIDNYYYLAVQAKIRQYTIYEIRDTMLSDSIIENKSYTFEYEGQLADFTIVVTDNKEEIELTPYMYGSVIDPEDKYYCWYLFSSDHTVRITFDSKSYIPGLSSSIYIKAYTTLGADGNFEYLGIDQTSEGVYIDIDSQKYGYHGLTSYLVAVTDSANGTNAKTKEELQKLIPKAAVSRGSITTETDLANYFNLINTDTNRLVMKRKTDNQLNRIWYGYFLLKDDYNNIIPSNTIPIKIDLNDEAHVIKCPDGRYIVPAGTYLRLDTSTYVAEPIDESLIPAEYTDEYFNDGFYYYVSVYNQIICLDPLYASYYLTISEHDSYFVYDYVNENSDIQFIANRFHFSRKLISDQGDYTITFNIAQSMLNENAIPLNYSEQVEMIAEDGSVVLKDNKTENLKVVLVLYKDGNPYRWTECIFDENLSNTDIGIYYFHTIFNTDDTMDNLNSLKISGCNEIGSVKPVPGYINEDCQAKIYILANTDIPDTMENPRKDLDNIAPGYEEYIVTNIYECVSGLDFYENYTGVTNTRIYPEGDGVYTITGIPCLGRHYCNSNENINFFIEALRERREYIDHCLTLVENSMFIDFKFFNSYGPATVFTLEDKTTTIGHIDISMVFKLSLKDATDTTTKSDIIQDIKAYIEDLNNTTDDLHIPNLITYITNKYEDRIYFIEFVKFNNFGADDQHIISNDDPDPFVVPEFINIRNLLDEESNTLVPDIEINLV